MTINEQVGRFSIGQESLDATSDHTRIGRYSDGQATHDDRAEQILVGRFSTGQELLAETVEHVRVGRFSDREPARPSIALSRQAETSDRLEVEAVSP
jgi:hypothetical protein